MYLTFSSTSGSKVRYDSMPITIDGEDCTAFSLYRGCSTPPLVLSLNLLDVLSSLTGYSLPTRKAYPRSLKAQTAGDIQVHC